MLSLRAQKIKPSPTLAIDSRAKEMKASCVDVVNFGVGEPDFDIPEPLKEEGIEWIRKGFNKYTPTQGIPELREKIASHLKKKKIHFEEVMVTAGVTGGLLLASLALINPGDEIIIPDPYFVMYEYQVLLMGGVLPAFEQGVKTDPSLLLYRGEYRLKEMRRQRVSEEEIRAIPVPAFLVFGDSDLTRPEHAVEMFRLLGGGVFGDTPAGLPNARLAILPGTSHVGMADRADGLAPMINEFLDAPVKPA